MRTVWSRARVLILLCGVLVAVHLLNVGLSYQLNGFGVIPRQMESLPHILTAPFIHGSFGHLLNNLAGLVVFGTLSLLRSVRFFFNASVFIIVLSGLLVWLFAREASHIGASGWIYGLWSVSIAIAWFDRRFVNILLAFVVVFFYGGMIFAVLPSDERISYEAHLFGVIAGICFAFLTILTGKKRRANQAG